MRFSLHTDYALRTLMFLADRRGRANVAEIAEFFRISRDHLAKVARRLAQEGFVRSVRGIGGGMELARRPNDIRVGEVVEAFEGSMQLLDCVSVPEMCVIQPGCRLRGVLAEAERVQMTYLHSVRLADIIQPEIPLVSLTLPSEPAAPRNSARHPEAAGRSSTKSKSPTAGQ